VWADDQWLVEHAGATLEENKDEEESAKTEEESEKPSAAKDSVTVKLFEYYVVYALCAVHGFDICVLLCYVPCNVVNNDSFLLSALLPDVSAVRRDIVYCLLLFAFLMLWLQDSYCLSCTIS